MVPMRNSCSREESAERSGFVAVSSRYLGTHRLGPRSIGARTTLKDLEPSSLGERYRITGGAATRSDRLRRGPDNGSFRRGRVRRSLDEVPVTGSPPARP